jgi:hypothetical protein
LDGGHSGVDDVGHGCEEPEGAPIRDVWNEKRGQERASSKRELSVREIELAGRLFHWSIWRSNWRRHVISLASSDRATFNFKTTTRASRHFVSFVIRSILSYKFRNSYQRSVIR